MFSKSQRFPDNGKKVTPGPGDYDIKTSQRVPLAQFSKEQRFSDSSDTESLNSSTHSLVGKSQTKEFKVPPAKQPLKKKSRRKTVSVQTDNVELISSETSRHADHEQVVTELRDQCSVLQTKLDDLQSTVDAEREKLNSELCCLKTEHAAKIKDLESSLDPQHNLVSQLNSDLSAVRLSADKLKEEKTDLTKRLEESSIATLELKDRLDSLSDLVSNKQSRVSELEIELDEEKSRSKANADSFRQEVAEFSTARDELNNRIESLNKTVELQEDTISSLTTSLARETELRMSTEASSKNKNETVACLKSANEQLQEQLGNMESVDSVRLERQAQLEQQVSNTSASITSLTNQLTELKLANEESRLQNDQLQLTNQTSAQTVLSLERNLQRKEAEMQTLNTKLAQVAQLKTFIKQKEAKIEELLDLNNLFISKVG